MLYTTPACRNPACRTPAVAGYADRGLCDVCERTALDALAKLPGVYARLWPRVRERRQRGPGPLSATKPGPSVPLDVELDAFLHEIEWTVGLWEEIVRERAGRPPRPGSVAVGCGVLSTWWPVLLACPPTAVQSYDHDIFDADGPDAAVWLTGLYQRASLTTGTTPGLVTLPGLCPAEDCGRPALRHTDGSDTVKCGACRRTWRWQEYQLHVELVTVGWVV